MSSNTKILVLRSKELVYALIFVILSVIIIIATLSVFASKKDSGIDDETTQEANASHESASSAIYIPGIYSSVVSIGDMNMELSVTLDYDHINSISFTNLDETVATLYPLMSPTLDELSAAILLEQSTQDITYSDENRYTSMLLMQAINEAIDKARIEQPEY
jgi:uncharacterized membrane protein